MAERLFTATEKLWRFQYEQNCSLVFCRGYSEKSLFRNQDKLFLTYKDRDTLQTRHLI